MTQENSLSLHVQRLRQEFDEAFSRLPLPTQTQQESFVSLQCAGAKYAVALREVALLHGNAQIVRLPSSNSRLLGVCCVRGELLAVFSLAAFLGHPEPRANTWIVRALGTTAAFAFERCEGQVRGSVQMTAGKDRVVVCPGELLPLLSLAEMIDTVRGHRDVASTSVSSVDAASANKEESNV